MNNENNNGISNERVMEALMIIFVVVTMIFLFLNILFF